MGVLVNYKFENLTSADVVLLGKAIGKLQVDEAADLHHRMQAQINAQEIAERDRLAAEREAAVEKWRAGEREKIQAELNAAKATKMKSTKSKKGS